jgi:Dyp-type peroxidase family
VEITYDEDGDRRPDLPGHEMFGFEDGVSQPGIRGRASNNSSDFITDRHIDASLSPADQLFGYPGQDLIWPGVLLLGYASGSPDPLIAGPPSPVLPEWTRNGSFLVFRRLRQDVGLFWRTIREKAAELSRQPGFSGITDERLASMLLGRWPSGAPFNRVPAADNPQLGEQQLANNNFRFDSKTVPIATTNHYQDPFPMAGADPAGTICPWAAHIRKVNTRDSASDTGGRDSTYKRRILRLGLPFGEPLGDRYAPVSRDPQKGNRGLLFLSAQASIEDQFEFLVSRWINDGMRPKPGGNDMWIGQNNAPGEKRRRRCTLFGSGLQQAEFATEQDWVIPTGGGYFFVPSIGAIREVLAQH